MITTLAEYQITEELYEGTRTKVYRGLAIQDSRPVVLKKLRKEYPTFSELLQFRHQYVITKNLEIAGIVKAITLEKEGNGYVLVMEDVGGISLLEYMGENPLNLDEFFTVALALIEILENLHKKRIIHKDIKPANILINPETKEIFLIDFSIASLLPKETQQLQNPNQLEGTLAYISPEQTGRMNRGIDCRSDFYGLGVSFYQMLTGQLPFDSSDAMELVHSHIAKIPTPPHQIKPEIPKVISGLVRKLMAKNAEDRYQSARGIKHDLEVCWGQWQEKGSISAFELASRDLSDRFFIPEKLYGRETEVQALLDAFDRVGAGTTEMMLVAGFSGIGKTAVVSEVHKPIVEKRGYFIKGKFDQFNRNIPFSALVIAFRDLMGQLLGETDASLEKWKQQILAALGEQAKVIIEVIPELENIIGKQPEVSELSGSAGQNRFNLLFGKFIQVFATREHPLVIFLDDLQWADSASLKLMELLINNTDNTYLLLVGAYRDNEVYAGHPLMLTLEEIGKTGARLNTISLSALSEKDLNYLVADTLRCALDVALPLTELVYQKAKGNPFFSNQFLKSLYEDGLISFNSEVNYWQCDLAKVKEVASGDDVVEFMASRISKLGSKTQKVLKLAACIGNQFDLATLAIVSEDSLGETAGDLWQALEEGLILPTSKIYNFFADVDELKLEEESGNLELSYKFLHDRVQQAAYSLIPEADKPKTHLRIGYVLLNNLPLEAREENIFELVGQLNYGTALITEQKERDQLAQLNLIACRKARTATAYQAGREYASTGLSLLGENPWQRQYQMSFAFHEAAAELASLCGDFAVMEQFVEKVIEGAKSLPEQVKVYCIRIQAHISQNKLTEAIVIAIKFLQNFGVTFPEIPTDKEVQQSMTEIEQLIGDRGIEDFVSLPGMTEPEKIAIVLIINSIMPAASISASPLFPLLVALSVKLSMQHGNISDSTYAYACYGLISCNLKQDVNTGVKFGELALQVVSKLDAKTVKPKVLFIVALFIFHRKSHIKEILPLLQESYRSALEAGNQEFAGYGAHGFCCYSLWCGQPLSTLERETHAYCDGLVQLNQLTTANWCRIYWQVMLNLLGTAEHPSILSGFALQESEILPRLVEARDFFGLYCFDLYKLMLCYLFGEIESAKSHAVEARRYLMAAAGTVAEPALYFYDSLTTLAELSLHSKETSEAFIGVEQNQRRLQQHWADYAPMNYQHKVDLVEAEKCRVLGQKAEAIELYDKAIAAAGDNGYIHEEALANELAAKFYLQWGKEKIARSYIIDAYYGYARWGAKAKVDGLEKRYPKLLAPILNQTTTDLHADLTQASISATSVLSSTTGISTLLNFASVIKASQALSQVLELEELLSKLMQAAMENAGASKGALLLPVGGALVIEALADYPPDADSIKISSVGRSLPLEDSQELPINVINTVKRARKMVVLNHATTDDRFLGDRYLREYQPQSVLCTPLLNRSKLIAILYLENRLASGAFTSDRLSLLDILTSQAAISLENARLYKQSQNYTLQLEEYLKQLQEAQLQLVQSEKMAAIGQLMAGVAHEINNPVGFIAGNLDYASEYIQSLKELLNLYQQGFDWNSETTQSKIEEIELDYLLEDFPELIQSMKAGTNRIAEISKSMRTFSRSDTEKKVSFNLHDGIDSTLLILKHRLKSNENRPEIEVVKNYSSLPEVKCYPGQLNQVFMNLIANAIDALEEAKSGGGLEEIKSHRERITITTEIDAEQQNAIVRIGDNGAGMPLEVKKKIFNHLFTTKKVGKGTGLGLSISRQIVVEKHGGTLTCTSEVGKGTEFAIALPLS